MIEVASVSAMEPAQETVDKLKDVKEKVSLTTTQANGVDLHDQKEYLHVFDSRTEKVYNIPVFDGFVRGSDLSTICAPIPGENGRMEKLAVLDPGFQHTACKESAVTLIDGEKGELRYRGVLVEDLFHNHSFDSTLYLLIWGHLPTDEDKVEFELKLAKVASPPQEVRNVIRSLPRGLSFFSMCIAAIATYVATDNAYVASTMALCYCHIKDVEFHEPQEGFTLVENFLHMIGMEDLDKKISRTIERLWILIADHELSCSTAAFLHVASTLTDPMTCLLAAISAGSGPLHAGAIELCYEGLEMLGTVDNVPLYIQAVKAKEFRLFGYGHRVYKTRDPRATLMEELMEEHREAVDANPLLQVALAIDKQANNYPYFVERKLKLNADFYGCFIYTALGIPKEMVPGLMTISRMGGLMAHWRESMSAPIKIWRPMQKYKA